MTYSDPAADYQLALDDLMGLSSSVARQQDHQQVLDAITRLRLAVVRAYGGQRPRHARGAGARVLILLYLQERVGEWVYGEELAAVSGIGEWARRVRELRVEHGFDIQEDGGRYRLVSREADEERRARWSVVGDVQASGGNPSDRVLTLFERLVGAVVTVDELDRVAGAKVGAQMARRLREEDGFPIETPADAPDLRAGDFRLASVAEVFRLDAGQRAFDEDLRSALFRRDRFRCGSCRRDRFEALREDRLPFFLTVRHADAIGSDVLSLPLAEVNNLSRLETWCIRCSLGLET